MTEIVPGLTVYTRAIHLYPTIAGSVDKVLDDMEDGEQLRLHVFAKRVDEAYGAKISLTILRDFLKSMVTLGDRRLDVIWDVPAFVTKLAPVEPEEPTQYQLAYLGHDDFDSRPLIEVRGEDDHELIAVSPNQSYDYLAGIDLYSDHVDVGVWDAAGEWVVIATVPLAGRDNLH